MADGLTVPLSSSEQIQSNYEKYKDKFKDSTEELVNSDTFLSLLVAEMTNQDPMEPTSNTEFVTQMAQFTSLTYNKDAAQYSKSNYASSLVGKTVTAQKMDGTELITKTGVVETVMKSGDNYTVKIDGVSFDISKVTSISETGSDSSSTGILGGNSLGSLIASASMMIGMSATVNPAVNGGSALDSGLIESIQVKDGQVKVIINDIAYDLEDIVEVAYPTYESGDDSAEQLPAAEEEQTAIGEVAEQMASENLEQLMEVIDTMNENERDRLEEEAEEVTEKVTADDFLSEDIPDLEELI
ncbi:MAG: flagellar hook assembly protein FlgD [Oscillospiraceae bacterium]